MSKIKLDIIKVDGGTQPRAKLITEVIEDYSQQMLDGVKFPPVVVFKDENKGHWLADGFHRYYAAVAAGLETLDADVKGGSLRDAVLFSVGANATHGMRRTNADKRHAVETLLNDAEWGKWSDRKIAEKCAVGPDLVGDLRRSLSFNDSDGAPRQYTTKHGAQSTMNTANIGNRVAVGDSEILRKAREIKTQRAEERMVVREAVNADAAKLNIVLNGDRYKLFTSNISDLSLQENSIDAIITDPPYPQEYIPLYGELSRVASVALKDNGICVVMTGQSYLEEVLRELSRFLTYQWTLAYLTPGASVQVFGRHIKSNWKPLIFLTKGANTWEHVDDTISSAERDKEYHEWGQSVGGMTEIIEKFTTKNAVILDPFCGGGATGVASLLAGRHFIGSDADEIEVKKTAKRLSEI